MKRPPATPPPPDGARGAEPLDPSMETFMSSLANIQSHLQTAGAHVGDLLWWSLDDARITCSRLHAIWTSSGLSPSFLPEAPSPEKALKTACREQATGRADYLIRLGKDAAEELVFAIVREDKDDAGNVHHSQEARVTLYRGPARLETDAPHHDVVRGVLESYARYLDTHTTDDVRRAVLRALDSFAAVTLREHGGVYWVPAPYAEHLRRLQHALSRIGRSRLDLVPIHETPEGNAALGSAARSAIEADLDALREEIQGFLAAPPDRPSTLMRRLQVFEELRAKAQLYQTVLNVQVGDLEASLTELTTHVEGLLSTLSKP